MQRLVSAAIVNGVPLDPILASRLSRLQARECPVQDMDLDPQLLADTMDEAAFVDQQQVEEAEQKHFERAIGQLEPFVEDKVLVCRRERASVAEKLDAAKSRRDSIVGAGAREKIEAEILRFAERLEVIEERIAALESREDEVYRKWRLRPLPQNPVDPAELTYRPRTAYCMLCTPLWVREILERTGAFDLLTQSAAGRVRRPADRACAQVSAGRDWR